jgi:hypothetical protein
MRGVRVAIEALYADGEAMADAISIAMLRQLENRAR